MLGNPLSPWVLDKVFETARNLLAFLIRLNEKLAFGKTFLFEPHLTRSL